MRRSPSPEDDSVSSSETSDEKTETETNSSPKHTGKAVLFVLFQWRRLRISKLCV